MSQAPTTRARSADEPEPTWDIAHLFPPQGQWSEEEYLALETNHLVEFSNGYLEVLPMPTTIHQMILVYLYGQLLAFSTARDLGLVLIAALRVRLWPRKFRDPDIVFMRKEHADRVGDDYWQGADLVMEVVSGDGKDRRRDLVKKRAEYARARNSRILDRRSARRADHGPAWPASATSSTASSAKVRRPRPTCCPASRWT